MNEGDTEEDNDMLKRFELVLYTNNIPNACKRRHKTRGSFPTSRPADHSILRHNPHSLE